MRKIAVIPGDGIGPEIMKAALQVLETAGFKAEWIEVEAGLSSVEKGFMAVPLDTIETIKKCGLVFKGPTTTPLGKGHTSANVTLRRSLDLFANVRPVHSLPGIKGHFSESKIDIIIVRENTEDLYTGIECQPHPDVAQALKIITRPGCQRLFKYTFEMAKKQSRSKVTVVHKANIMKLTDGMFLDEFYTMAKEYPSIESNDMIVDNCCMQLVTNPEQFDIIVTENLYGDIVSDLCAGLVGGLGLVPSANIGIDCALFEAVHGSAPDIAGKGVANPTALLMSSILMLEHLGELTIAHKIKNAIEIACRDQVCLTADLGGKATTQEYCSYLCDNMK